MKLYPTLNVETTFQNCGSWWLLILCGKEEEIELTFNGLFNQCATNMSDALEYTDHTRTKAVMWTKPEYMFNFFFNSHLLATQQDNATEKATAVANLRMEELKKCMVPFFDFTRQYMPDGFSMGTARAERPDDNYKEKALSYSLRKSGETVLDKA
jgi:hypothetical protein